MIKRVLFIRPGETDWNRMRRWQGQVAVPLNAHGREQAHRLARFIQPLGMKALYSSDLRRAVDTANILAEAMGIKPIFDKRLRERHIGEWQGLTQEEVIAWYPEEYARLQANPLDYQIAGGESRRQVMARVRACFDDIMQRGGGDIIGIITHSTAIRTLLTDLVPNYDPNSHAYSNMSVTTIERQVEDNVWRIRLLDDISHLDNMETFSSAEIDRS